MRKSETLSDTQLKRLLEFVKSSTRKPQRTQRNAAIVLLAFKAGLRMREIAGLTWEMVVDEDVVGGKDNKFGIRNIPIHAELKAALVELYEFEKKSGRGTATSFVVTLSKKENLNINSRSESLTVLFNGKAEHKGWFAKLGFDGATSHTGRRTFTTNAARMVSSV